MKLLGHSRGVVGVACTVILCIGAIEVQSSAAGSELPGSCPSDCGDGDGNVGITDFLALLAQWGGLGTCDIDGGGVGITDFLTLLSEWGECPPGGDCAGSGNCCVAKEV